MHPAPLQRRGGDAVRDGREASWDSTGPPVPERSTRLHCPASVLTSSEGQRRGRNFPCGAEGSGFSRGSSSFQWSLSFARLAHTPARASLRCPQQASELCVTHLISVPNVSWGRTKVNGAEGCRTTPGDVEPVGLPTMGRRHPGPAPSAPRFPGRQNLQAFPAECRWHTRARRGTFSLISLWDTLTPPQGDREFRGDGDK